MTARLGPTIEDAADAIGFPSSSSAQGELTLRVLPASLPFSPAKSGRKDGRMSN